MQIFFHVVFGMFAGFQVLQPQENLGPEELMQLRVEELMQLRVEELMQLRVEGIAAGIAVDFLMSVQLSISFHLLHVG